MGLIAAIFLLYVSQEEAFTLLMKLITKYEMGGLFEPGFPTLYKLFFIHEKLLRLWLPNLDAHFVWIFFYFLFFIFILFLF